MTRKNIALIKFISLIIIIVVIPIILYLTCQDTLFNTEWLKTLPEILSQNKLEAVFILTGIQVLQVIICIIPGQPIQFAASYMFGIIGGYLISIVGAIIGAVIAFYLAKLLGSESLKIIFNENIVENYKLKINSGRGLLITFIIYLIPGFPKDLVSYVAGISNMRILPFILVSSVGRSPGMLGSLFFGKFFQNENYRGIVTLSIICILILIICLIFKDRLIKMLDNLENRDIERETKHNGKKTNK